MPGARAKRGHRVVRPARLTADVDDRVPLLARDGVVPAGGGTVTLDVGDPGGQHPALAASQAGHLVAAVAGHAGHRVAEEDGAAENEDAHGAIL